MIPITYGWERKDGKEIFIGEACVSAGMEIPHKEFRSPDIRQAIVDEAKGIIAGKIHGEIYGSMERELVEALEWAMDALKNSPAEYCDDYDKRMEVLKKHTSK